MAETRFGGPREVSDKQRRMQDTLEKLASARGMLGALLVTRDGFCLINKCPKLSRPETFSAMSAVLVGSAETALLELGRDPARRTIAEAGPTRVVATGINDELLLVAVSELSLPLEPLLGSLDEAAQSLAKVAAGG